MPPIIVQKEIYRVTRWQLSFVTVLALLFLMISGVSAGIATLCGGLAYCFPNFVFVWRVSSSPNMSMLVLNEIGKLSISAILLIIGICYFPRQMSFVLSGYIFAVIAAWGTLFMAVWNSPVEQA